MRCVILANGQFPELSVFEYFKNVGFRTLICADGGANSAFEIGLNPDYIIGDLDSAREEVLQHFNGKAEIIHYERQNDTDVEKCLKFAIEAGYKEVVLLGATGDRLDHTFCNMGIVLKFFSKIKIYIVHQKSIMEAIEGSAEFNTLPGEIISLYGFDDKTFITTEGFKYPLKGETLQFGVRESTSNEAVGNKVKVTIKGGKIFVIRGFKEVCENGYFKSA